MPVVTIKPTRRGHSQLPEHAAATQTAAECHARGRLRRAFGDLLRVTARKRDWTLVEEQSVGRVRPDGTLHFEHFVQYNESYKLLSEEKTL